MNEYEAAILAMALRVNELQGQIECLKTAGNCIYDELESWSLTEQGPETIAAFEKWRAAVKAAPEQCMANFKASAIDDAVKSVEFRSEGKNCASYCYSSDLREYANQLRQQDNK